MCGRAFTLAGVDVTPQKHRMTANDVGGWTESVGVRAQRGDVVIAVEGDDARTWLNGQITNDLKRLRPDTAVYGLVLSAKGRILTDVVVLEPPGALVFALPAAAWPAVHEHLEKYIIMEDVTLRETTLALLTLAGARAGELDVERQLAGLDVTVSAHDRLGPGREILVERANEDEALRRLVAAAQTLGGGLVDDVAWEAARVQRAVPRWSVDFGERTYPQEAGLKRALAFDKGCYLGQEVVCMLENRGQVTRSLVALALPPGASVGAALLRGGETVGEVTSVAGPHALALVKRVASEPGTELDTPQGTAQVVRLVG